MNSPKQGVSNLPEICYQMGMRHVVISPGSRNAPLIFAFTSHTKIKCYSIVDERTAAYTALGIALQTQQSVGIICTSGTANLNFTPAIAEAYYQHVPLVVITADRPSEWIDQGDGQTIRQSEIYRNYIKQSFNLPVETTSDSDLWHFNKLVNEALTHAQLLPLGPVHLNVPLREPLYAPLPNASVNSFKTLINKPQLSDELLETLLVKWNSFAKKMIICGFDTPDNERSAALSLLANSPSVIIVAENISNLYHESIISSPERFFASLSNDEAIAFRPDLLITIGNSVVSARLKKYLRQYSPTEHWSVQSSPAFVDTYQCLTQSIVASSSNLLHQLHENDTNTESNYRNMLHAKEKAIRVKHSKLISSFPYSDLTIFDSIIKQIPSHSNIHLANSTPIRYSQLFDGSANIQYFCNRGTSGIDGCVSTAAGFAMTSEKLNILITGDISFIYDSNGLWNKYLNGNFKIIVINNGGGNIFRLIDSGKDNNPAREFFETPHNVNIKLLAQAFNVDYNSCHADVDLNEKINWLFQPNHKVSLLEIVTDAAINTRVYKEYFSALSISDS